MNKNYSERMEEANEWLISMYDSLPLKTNVEDIEYLQKRIDLFEWIRGEIYRLHGGETFKGYKEMYEYSECIKNNALEQIDVTQRRNERLEIQSKQYREVLEFYANEYNWMPVMATVMMDEDPEIVEDVPLALDDNGERARQALGESDE